LLRHHGLPLLLHHEELLPVGMLLLLLGVDRCGGDRSSCIAVLSDAALRSRNIAEEGLALVRSVRWCRTVGHRGMLRTTLIRRTSVGKKNVVGYLCRTAWSRLPPSSKHGVRGKPTVATTRSNSNWK